MALQEQNNSLYSQRQLRSAFSPLLQKEIKLDSTDLKINDEQQSTDVDLCSTNSKSSTQFVFDLKKYKHDYFLSKLLCDFDMEYGKFHKPMGICSLNDDRLLVSNFYQDSLLLIDINGTVHQIYKYLQSPKDVRCFSSNPLQAVVATKTEIVIMDLNTSAIVSRSQMKGFYPWNVFHMKEKETFAACDPAGERIIFFDKNLNEVGNWPFNDKNLLNSSQQTYKKVYPYAAYFSTNDNTAYVITQRESQCYLEIYSIHDSILKRFLPLTSTPYSYSIYVDDSKKCFLTDNTNHRLISIDDRLNIDEYQSSTLREPCSMTFLSDGTICVTDWNTSYGTSGGIAIISENDLKLQS